MNQIRLRLAKYFMVFTILGYSLLSCDKLNDSAVPDVYVNFSINLSITNDLTIPGNSVYFPGVGYGGIIVTCYNNGEWYAFDAACTYEVSPNCKVQESDPTGTCSCCNSEYLLMGSGYPTKGPASMPLKQYHVSIVNPLLIRVYN